MTSVNIKFNMSDNEEFPHEIYVIIITINYWLSYIFFRFFQHTFAKNKHNFLIYFSKKWKKMIQKIFFIKKMIKKIFFSKNWFFLKKKLKKWRCPKNVKFGYFIFCYWIEINSLNKNMNIICIYIFSFDYNVLFSK